MPERSIVICREITKKFEEVIRGTAKSIQAEVDEHTLKGEFVVVIAPKNWRDINPQIKFEALRSGD